MKRNPISSNPVEVEDLGVKTDWTVPCRGMQPIGFPISHEHEDWPKAPITADDFARLTAEFAELRELVAEMHSEIQKTLSRRKELRLCGRTALCAVGDAAQGVLPFLPTELATIADVIEGSKVIFNRPPDSSDNLGLACSQETWRRAIKILIDHALSIWKKARTAIRPPVISAGPDGSVDLYWIATPYGLLLNVPADPKQPATYYGDDATNPESNRTSGKLDLTKPIDIGVLMWLAHTTEQ